MNGLATRITTTAALTPAWARWLLAAAAAGALVFYLDPTSVARELEGVRWTLALPAITGLVLAHALAALTWRRLSKLLLGYRLPARDALTAYYAAQATGLLTPANLGADAYRARAVRGASGGWRRAFAPVALQRLGNYAGLAAMALAASLFVPIDAIFRAILAASALAAVIALLVLWRRSMAGGEPVIGAEPPPSTSRAAVEALVLGVFSHAVSAVCMVATVRAVSPDGSLFVLGAAVLVARVATVIPLTPGGIGVHEAALSVLLSHAGVEPEAAVAAGALARLSLLATVAIGGAALAAKHLHRPTARAGSTISARDIA
jgi:uncharacterized membrane protein YbhN (UPF0104 family)